MKYLIALCMMLVGCAPATEYTFSPNAIADAEDYVEIVAAAADWNACHVVKVHVTRGGGIPVVLVPAESIPGEQGETGFWFGTPQRILYREGNVRAVVSHEMGHVFGLGHDSSGIMTLVSAYQARVSSYDCERLVRGF